MENEDLIQVAKLADASLELFNKQNSLKGKALDDALVAWKQVCQNTVSNIGKSPQILLLGSAFQLSNQALTAICLIILPQVNSLYLNLYSELSDEESNTATMDVVSSLVTINYTEKSKLLLELGKESPVFYWNYLLMANPGLNADSPLAAGQLFVNFMAGQAGNQNHDLLTLCTTSPLSLEADSKIKVPESQLQIISGGFAERQLTLAIKFAVNYYQRPLYSMNAGVLKSQKVAREALKDALAFAFLNRGIIYWQNAFEDFSAEPGFVPAVNAWLQYEKNIFITGEEVIFDLPASINPYKTATVKLRPLTHLENKEVWQSMGSALLGNNNVSWDIVNNNYAMDMTRVGQTLLRLRQVKDNGKTATTLMLQNSYLDSSARQLGGLAYLDYSNSTFEQMVLNDTTKSQLDTLQKTYANRIIIDHIFYLGFISVFTGHPGNGKTMAAESLANALKLPLYRLDYTQLENTSESSLARLFDEAETNSAVLLFDEADALFTTKSNSNGPGNLVTAFLIQRLESYSGLAILTTNSDQRIDPAFFRRAVSVINFPALNSKERYALFQKLFAEKNAKPGNGLNLATVAESIAMSGRSINNVVNTSIINAVDENPGVTPIAVSQANFSNAIKQEIK